MESASLQDLTVTPASSSAPHPRIATVERSTGRPLLPPGCPAHSRNYGWAELMTRVFELDVLEFPRYLRRIKIMAAIHFSDAHSKVSGLPGSSVARSAIGDCRFRPHRTDGLVLKVVVTTPQGRCAWLPRLLPCIR
jgi:hypothetical protein